MGGGLVCSGFGGANRASRRGSVLSLAEFKGIERGGNCPVCVLSDVEHGPHILQSAFLACLTREDHHLAQDVEGKSGIRRFGVLDNDLCEYEPGDVFAGGRVDNLNAIAVLQHLRHLVKVHILTVGGVVEPPVFVLLDEDRLRFHTVFIIPLDNVRGERKIEICCSAAIFAICDKSTGG